MVTAGSVKDEHRSHCSRNEDNNGGQYRRHVTVGASQGPQLRIRAVSDKLHMVVANSMASHAGGVLPGSKEEVIQVHLQVAMIVVTKVEVANEGGNVMTVDGVTVEMVVADLTAQAQGVVLVICLQALAETREI